MQVMTWERNLSVNTTTQALMNVLENVILKPHMALRGTQKETRRMH
jgi:hypothetical protein